VASDDRSRVFSVAISNLTEEQIGAWAHCGTAAAVANPFFEPDCQVPAIRFLPKEKDARLYVAERSGNFVACLPLLTISSRLGPLHRQVAYSRAFETSIGLGSPLLDGPSLDDAVNGLLDALEQGSKQGGPGIVTLDWLDDDEGGVGRALRAACVTRHFPLRERRTWERPVVRRTEQGLSLKDHLSTKVRSEMRRRQRRLEEKLGGPLRLLDRSDTEAVDEFMRLEASGWKGREGSAYLKRPDAQQWFRGLCHNFASTGRLHLLSLEVDGRSVAMQCFLQSGTSFFSLRVGHDEELNAYGPGVLLHVAAIEYLDTLNVDLVDSCADPGNPYWSDLYPDRRRMANLVLATGSRADRLAVKSFAIISVGQRLLSRLKKGETKDPES
jgi:hypothetical protein